MNTLYHIQVAHAAFDKYLTPKAVDVVIRYNFNTDFYSSIGWKALQHKVVPFYPIARRWYKRSDHFDEMPDSGEIVATWNHHYGLIMDLLDDAKYPPNKLKPIWRILGRSSHALSDITAHSNLVHLYFEYFANEPDARKTFEASGKSMEDFLAESGPTLGMIISEPRYADFREKYFPRYFSYQSMVDVGPRCHDECSLDKPTSKGCRGNPVLFKIAFAIAQREAVDIVHAFFEKLKAENPAKFKSLAEAFNDAGPQGEHGKYASRARFWAAKFGGWD
ncbi:MAG: hypothetical protein WCX65_00740 [bacterium]